MRIASQLLPAFRLACLGAAAVGGAGGCGATGQEEITYSLSAQGRPAAPFLAGAWQVTLEVARVGFGPLYLCASASASRDNCSPAVAEFAAAATVDALRTEPQPLGEITALTAQVRSAMYGYAYIWPLTRTAPLAVAGAPGGHSAHFEGTAVQGASTLRFVADVDVLPTFSGTLAVQGAAVAPTVQSAGLRLEATFDPVAWWSQVDFDDLATIAADPVPVTATSRAYNTLVIAMTSTDRPTLIWTRP